MASSKKETNSKKEPKVPKEKKIKAPKEKKIKAPKVAKPKAVKKEKTAQAVTTRKTARKASKETTTLTHALIPLHEKITEKEIQEIFEYHNITMKELPKILKNDPAIRHLDAKENDVIKITRTSQTAGKSIFYRGVINE